MEEFDLDQIIQKLNQKDETNREPKRKEQLESSSELDEAQLAQILELCQSKAEEFALIGYDKVNKEEIWRYFESKYRKHYPPLHRMVNEILSLKVNSYMNWITINAYKGL